MVWETAVDFVEIVNRFRSKWWAPIEERYDTILSVNIKDANLSQRMSFRLLIKLRGSRKYRRKERDSAIKGIGLRDENVNDRIHGVRWMTV